MPTEEQLVNFVHHTCGFFQTYFLGFELTYCDSGNINFSIFMMQILPVTVVKK